MMSNLEDFVSKVVDGTASDDDCLNWLREVFDNGLNRDETILLTELMRDSGTTLSWSANLSDFVADKHSTGGVGDKISIPLAPALAACGLYVPMISGRGLGHTGGTLDKLESIRGFNVGLDASTIIDQVENIGVCMVGQTEEIVPADKRLYALRDVSGTIASLPLITSSIVSKKAAEGLSALVLDVKYGRAAFMTGFDDAKELAMMMCGAANGLGIRTSAVLTEMNDPIGYAVGNALEIVESVETLCGRGPHDVEELVCVIGGILLADCGLASDVETGSVKILDSLWDGSAFEKFLQMVDRQGGSRDDFSSDLKLLESLGLLNESLHTTELSISQSGFVSRIDALTIGKCCVELGAGRKKVDDSIDLGVGVLLEVQVGERVESGDSWITIFHRGDLSIELKERISEAISLSSEPVEVKSRIIEVIK